MRRSSAGDIRRPFAAELLWKRSRRKQIGAGDDSFQALQGNRLIPIKVVDKA
jgi:hypothetical protein